MKNNNAFPSDWQSTVIPAYIYDNYANFAKFMEESAKGQERIGFGQDILENLNKYRDLDTYKDQIVQFGALSELVAEDGTELKLVDGFGFPDENGVLLIDDEVILYQEKDGDTLYGLQRGASGTTVLPTLRSSGAYVKTVPAVHTKGSKVTNLSVLFLVAMLDNIHKSTTPNIESVRITPEVNRSSLLANIRDFFASKGSKLGVKALFRMLFNQTDVEVSYPGDRMIKPSTSTFSKTAILRTLPMPRTLADPSYTYITPIEALGTRLKLKDYNTGEVVGSVYSDYATTYPQGDTIQYEYYVDVETLKGKFSINPTSKLTRALNTTGSSDDRKDVTTVTVESTIGFPSSGVIFIDNEAIKYTSKTSSQFLGCTRGYVNVEAFHEQGTEVHGPYYIEASYTEGTEKYGSFTWPQGLVTEVTLRDRGLLQDADDQIIAGDPGKTDPRNVTLESIQENVSDDLVTQTVVTEDLPYVSNYTSGVSAIYFDEKFTYIATSNLPAYPLETFSTDGSIGSGLHGENSLHIIPQRSHIQENTDNTGKGNDIVGVAVDGIPLYSNISKDGIVFGKLLRFDVIDGGRGYVDPVLLVEGGAQGDIEVVDGRIRSVSVLSTPEYTEQPEVTITSGIGAAISLSFDTYGRVIGAEVIAGGQYYNTPPTLSVDDTTQRGGGALLTCEVYNGAISAVTILQPGIDYNPLTTTLGINPVGKGAQVVAVCEEYTFDEYTRIRATGSQNLDSSNAFLFKDVNGEPNKFAYLGNPNALRESLNDNGSGHSPILGWAVDGNPIYGPWAFANGVDASGGLQLQNSGYYLPRNRSEVIPKNGTEAAGNPPSVDAYPMGSFIQDYVYDPEIAAITGANLRTENAEILQTELDENIQYTRITTGILNEFNGKVCNTPEFPAELYPDGVFCYFMTVFGDLAGFPYNIGPVFRNRPQGQNKQVSNYGEILAFDNPESSYDQTLVEVDFTQAARFRNAELEVSSQDLSIGFDGIDSGVISSVGIEDGEVPNVAVGDYLHFDNYGSGGSGAQAVVTHVSTVAGSVVPNSPTEAAAGGFAIETTIMSHRQQLNLKDTLPEGQSYTFPISSIITTNSGSTARVESYDQEKAELIVQVTTKELIKYGDFFFDARGTRITLPSDPVANEALFGSNVSGTSNVYMDYVNDPEEGMAGDLWWSSSNGRLYINYNDGDSAQWVSAFPNGMRPVQGATDTNFGAWNNGPGTPDLISALNTGSTVAIGTIAPARRTDGSANQKGDLWWSTHTGMLYIATGDASNSYDGGDYLWTTEWVCTDPIGMVSMEGASNEYEYDTLSAGGGPEYNESVRVLISDSSPTTMSDGSALVVGTLWWSPINGKMYIYYYDGDSYQWVIVNPSGTLTGQYSSDSIFSKNDYYAVVSILPETINQEVLWVDSIEHTIVGDTLVASGGVPTEDGPTYSESFEILEIDPRKQLVVERGPEETRIPLDHGMKVQNTSRYIYRVITQNTNGLSAGIEIDVVSPANPGMDGTYTVAEVGNVEVAEGQASIDNGQVIGVTIVNPGLNYTSGHYVYFVGGGGVGAYGYASINEDGEVTGVEILEGGVNYTSIPAVVFDTENSNKSFYFYTDELYVADPDLTYDTTDVLTWAPDTIVVSQIELLSNGFGYTSLPKVTGIIHKQMDRGQLRPTLDGTAIDQVEILEPGLRYDSPVVVFGDLTGSGSGAEATVTVNGVGSVTGITVTNGGSGYVEPTAYLMEPGGVFTCNTTTIGKVRHLLIEDPGRDISGDRSLAPDIQMDVKIVFSRIKDFAYNFTPGDVVYQGSDTHRLAEGTVQEVDTVRQLITLRDITGYFKIGENIYASGTKGGVVTSLGQADIFPEVGAISNPYGRYIDQTSMVSDSYAVTQDSDVYQTFSYKVASSLQKVQYETFVRDIVHPAGFNLLSDVLISQTVKVGQVAEDAIIEQGSSRNESAGTS